MQVVNGTADSTRHESLELKVAKGCGCWGIHSMFAGLITAVATPILWSLSCAIAEPDYKGEGISASAYCRKYSLCWYEMNYEQCMDLIHEQEVTCEACWSTGRKVVLAVIGGALVVAAIGAICLKKGMNKINQISADQERRPSVAEI